MLDNLRQLPRYRGLIQSLVARELKARYRGSVLGFFWSFFNPLLLLLVYTFVFAYVMPPPKDIQQLRAVPLLRPAALDVVLDLADRVVQRPDHGRQPHQEGDVSRPRFCRSSRVLSNLVHFLLGLPILVAFLIYFDAPMQLAELAWFPVVVLVQLLLTLGLALILSALTVHFRDIKDILANVMTLWFFATPIIYPTGRTRRTAIRPFLNLNPFTHLAISYQEILFFPADPARRRPVRALEVAARARRGFARAVSVRLFSVRSPARLVRGGGVSHVSPPRRHDATTKK